VVKSKRVAQAIFSCSRTPYRVPFFCLAISSCTHNPESAFQTAGYAETVARLQQKVSLTHPQRGYVDATQRAWAAMLRTLDRVSPVYRD
jgi:hypothetical protein